MIMPAAEKPHPLYLLLLLASLLFVVTALAYAVVPILEDWAVEAGEPAPPSALRAAVRSHGWLWLLIELAVMVVLGIASMTADRLRTLQKQRAEATITPRTEGNSPKNP
jgi:hypothetical protein